MNSDKLSTVIQALISAAIFALFILFSVINNYKEPSAYDSIAATILAVAVIISSTWSAYKLQNLRDSRISVLKPDDVDPGTVIKIVDNRVGVRDVCICIRLEDRFVYEIASAENENERYLLETKYYLPVSDDGYLIKSAAGDFSPYTGDVKDMK